VLGRGWDPRTRQVTPFYGIPSVTAVDIDIPADSDHQFIDNSEPIADIGCACGIIPSGIGCR
jgi:hypothetical protein